MRNLYGRTIALVLFALFPALAFAQAVLTDSSTAAPGFDFMGILKGFLTPGGVAGALGTVLAIIAGFQWFTGKRKKILATAVYHAFHIVEDVGAMLEGEDNFDKTARFFAAIDAQMIAQGYRELTPGEKALAQLQAQAIHGGEVAKAKVVESAISAVLPSNPPSA